MHTSHKPESLRQTLKERIEAAAHCSVADCYQCGKCSAGCPVAGESEVAPNQILRMLQLDIPELEERALGSEMIWLCLGCQTCVSRCPQGVDLPSAMDALRAESAKLGKVHPRAKDIVAFHRAFLDSIESNGRSFEFGLILGYKMRTLHLMQDVALAPKMLAKGKLKFFPHRVHNREAIARIFERAAQEEKA
ncbi:MAG: 4Fe-4S dicluster domain-containing protein [Chloroflexota bacterium]